MAVATLVITYDSERKQVDVKGPVEQTMLCYAMLELAKDAVRAKMAGQPEASKIVQPQGGIVRL